MQWTRASLIALTLMALPFGPGFAQDNGAGQAPAEAAQAQAEANRAAEERAVAAGRQTVEEAVAALDETAKAIEALKKNDTETAAAALERAIGKLEVVLTRDPELTLAPVDVASVVVDIVATPEEIEAARKEALRLMKDDQLQRARPLVSALASEVQIETTLIPLGTYPLALKSAAALIKDGKVEDGIAVLENALATLVVERTILPLPVLRAGILIDEAKALAEKQDRSDDEENRLGMLLDALDLEIAKGRALQYGTEETFDALEEEMEAIRAKLDKGDEGKGLFDKLTGMFEKVTRETAAAAK